jgi:hypothetical protein
VEVLTKTIFCQNQNRGKKKFKKLCNFFNFQRTAQSKGKNSANLVTLLATEQGDQIGRIFAIGRLVVFFGQFKENFQK